MLLLYTRFVEFRPDRPIRVLKRVVSAVPTARLLVVGQGLRGEEAHLLQAAQAEGVQDHVIYVGWLTGKALAHAFAAADLALYPYDDTLLNRTKCSAKLIDLMAAGVPVIADAVGQNVEYIVPGQSGVLVSPGDIEAMAAAAVELLCAPPNVRAALGQAAAQRVRQVFAWGRLALEVERAYGGPFTPSLTLPHKGGGE